MPPNENEEKKEKEAQGEGQEKKQEAQGAGLTPEQTRQALAYVLNQNKTLATELAQLRGEFAAARGGQPKATGGEKEELPDIETMSRADFANFIVKQVQDRLVKPAVERVAVKEEEDEKKQLRREIQEFAAKQPEFWTFADEVKQVLSKYPDLNVEEAFVLARSSAPEKARKMDEAAIEAKRKEEEKKVEERRSSFGGLLPTSGRTTKAKNMSSKDAAEQAWQDTEMTAHLAAIASE